MDEDIKARKQSMNLKWVKGKGGHTYLCPADKLAKLNNPTDADLKRICVDESENPQND
jgi:ribonuclease HI